MWVFFQKYPQPWTVQALQLPAWLTPSWWNCALARLVKATLSLPTKRSTMDVSTHRSVLGCLHFMNFVFPQGWLILKVPRNWDRTQACYPRLQALPLSTPLPRQRAHQRLPQRTGCWLGDVDVASGIQVWATAQQPWRLCL